MTRVRGFTQDDAHLFCTEEQVAGEFRGCIEMTQFVLKTLGLDDYRVRLGFRDPEPATSTSAARRTGSGPKRPCEAVCTQMNLPNLHRSSRARRRSTARRPTSSSPTASAASGSSAPCSSTTTCPPAAFDLEYIGADNQPAPAGDDPPRAVRLDGAVRRRADRALRRGVPPVARAGASPRDDRQPESRGVRPPGRGAARGRPASASPATIGRKRSARRSATPSSSSFPTCSSSAAARPKRAHVAVRDRLEGDLGAMPLAAAIERLQAEVAARTIRQVVKGSAGLGGKQEGNEY